MFYFLIKRQTVFSTLNNYSLSVSYVK